MTEQTKAQSTDTEQVIIITPTAIAEIKRLMTQEKEENLFLRMGVTSGGCSGLSYTMGFDTERGEFDREFDFDGLKVLVDLKALMYLAGTTLDYSGGLNGGFAFKNPKATRSCGCGSSFSC
jgi:iron-sulfur cluster assembly protein